MLFYYPLHSFTLALKLINKYKKNTNHPQCVKTRKSKSQRKIYTMQKALFEPGTPVFIYRLFQFATVGLLILLIVLYTQGKFIFIVYNVYIRINRIIILMN